MSDLILVKIWLSKKKTGETTKITYPPIFDDATLKGIPYMYQDTGEIGDNVREFLAGFIVPGTSISRIREILEDPDIEPMTEEEVNELGNQIYPEMDLVGDSEAAILALAHSPDERTPKEIAILDPSDPELGINHREPYNIREQISEYFTMAEEWENRLP